jgi:hypothetical protein
MSRVYIPLGVRLGPGHILWCDRYIAVVRFTTIGLVLHVLTLGQ